MQIQHFKSKHSNIFTTILTYHVTFIVNSDFQSYFTYICSVTLQVIFAMNYRIKDICRDKGIAIGALADTIGMQRESLSRIINGANTSTETLERIASTLDVDIAELFNKPAAGNFTCPKCGTSLRLKAEKA